MSRFQERLNRLSLEEREYFVHHSPTSLAEVGETESLHRLLTNFEFLEVKVSMVEPQLLIDDYELSNEGNLRVIQGALRREAHILVKYPNLLWQQLYNRLQWEKGINAHLLAEERERRSRIGIQPWLWLRTPFSESPTLIRTLFGHTHDVTACAFSPDGTTISLRVRLDRAVQTLFGYMMITL